MTQEQRFLKLLKERGDIGAYPTELIGLGVTQYGRAINSLRTDFGCICKNGNTTCPATEHIINKRITKKTTKFFYRMTANPLEWLKDARKPVIHDDVPQLF